MGVSGKAASRSRHTESGDDAVTRAPETTLYYSRARTRARRAPARSFLSLVGTETKIAVCVLGEKR